MCNAGERMDDIIAVCDIDNTLICSHRRKQADDVCVEWFEGREQSFMPPDACRLWERVMETRTLIPLTTRSIVQYRRIRWHSGAEPEYALVTNGAILLRHGDIDETWRKETWEYIAPYYEEMRRLCSVDVGVKGRIVDGSYIFIPCADEASAHDCAAWFEGRTPLHTACSGRKVYLLPPDLHKGAALDRLRQRMPCRRLICAGDSAMDVPMLQRADLALVPDAAIASAVGGGDVRCCPKERRFPEFVLDTILKYMV